MTPRILIADDSQPVLEAMAAILDSCGYLVTMARDGLDAWEAVGRAPPAMVVLDIEMPGLDGCEVCRRIKSQPETRNIPVLLVSGCGRTGELARNAGADGFLDKPFFLKDLLGQVNSMLARGTEQAALAAAK
jgi:CheY-like chemotaxis protein